MTHAADPRKPLPVCREMRDMEQWTDTLQATRGLGVPVILDLLEHLLESQATSGTPTAGTTGRKLGSKVDQEEHRPFVFNCGLPPAATPGRHQLPPRATRRPPNDDRMATKVTKVPPKWPSGRRLCRVPPETNRGLRK